MYLSLNGEILPSYRAQIGDIVILDNGIRE